VAEVQLDEARSGYESAQAELEVARFDHSTATIRAPSDGRILTRSVEVAEFTTPGVPAFRFGSTSQGWIVRVHVADHHVAWIALGSPARVVLPGLDPQGVQGRVVEAADPRSGTFEVEVEIGALGADTRGDCRGPLPGPVVPHRVQIRTPPHPGYSARVRYSRGRVENPAPSGG